MTDIECNKNLEVALKAKEAELEDLYQLGQLGRWDLYHRENRLEWTQSIYDIFEITRDRFGATYDAFLAAIHPDDRPAVDSAWQQSLIEKKPYTIEHRLLMGDGRIKWLSEKCRTEFDDTGAPVHSFGIVQDITERKLAEEETHIHKTISDNTVYGKAYADLNGNLVYVNKFFASIHGYTPEELIGQNLSVFHTPEQLTAVERTIGGMLETGAFEPQEIWHVNRNGKVFPMLMSGLLLRDDHGKAQYIATSAVDITDRKQAEEDLKAAKTRLQIVSDNMLDLVSVTDLNGNYKFTGASHEIIGYEPQDLLGKNVMDFVHPEDFNHVQEAFTEFLTGSNPRSSATYRNRCANGSYLWFETYGTFIMDEAGKPTEILFNTRDITDRKRAEEELLLATRRAEAASLAKSQFLANMSHEIRTPINGIVGFLQLLGCTRLDQEQSEYLNVIRDSADTLLKLIHDILDVARIEAGKIDIESIEFRLKALLESAIAPVVIKAREKDLGIDLFIGDDVPDSVVGDPTRLKQIIINLASNAVKFTEEGNIIVVVGIERSEDAVHYIRFSVEDTGIGMTEEELRIVFEPFTQADSSASKRFGGAGLGLAICRSYVEAMNGRISAQSVKGKGSVFSFVVPFGKTQYPEEMPQARDVKALRDYPAAGGYGTASYVKEVGCQSRPRILLVEDDEVSRKLMAKMLEKEGLRFDIAVNGQEGVSAHGENTYDLIFMDCQMPVLDGYEATKRIREAESNGRHTRIIAMTAYAMPGDREKCIKAGMDGYVSKPVALGTIRDIIAQHSTDDDITQ